MASEPFIGQIQAYGFYFAPRGWMTCQGQLLSIASNTALFSLLGTTYGGNGQQTFGLPDLRGRVAIGQGNGPGLTPRTMGEIAGSESLTITTAQMPMHVHAIAPGLVKVSANPGTVAVPTATENTIGAVAEPNLGTPNNLYNSDTAPAIPLNGGAGTTAVAGGSQPIPLMNPYLVINYSIAVQGVFPSRN